MKVNKSLVAKAKRQAQEERFARRMEHIVNGPKGINNTYTAMRKGIIIARGLSLFECVKLGSGATFVPEG